MRLTFREIAPAAEPAITALRETPIIQQAVESVWVFAVIEAAHLLSLAVIGGAVLALNLRLLGLVLTDEAAALVERRTRPWLHAGVIGGLSTGVAMGIMNATGLYGSVAFFVKMVALLAAILFSYAVVREVVREREAPSRTAIAVGLAALATWAFAIFVFSTTRGTNPGVILVVAAGAALLVAATRRYRVLLMSGLAALGVVGWLVTRVLLSPDDNPMPVEWATVGFVTAAALFALGVGALELRATTGDKAAPAKLVAFASTLAWVTVAAAGRWIGFS